MDSCNATAEVRTEASQSLTSSGDAKYVSSGNYLIEPHSGEPRVFLARGDLLGAPEIIQEMKRRSDFHSTPTPEAAPSEPASSSVQDLPNDFIGWRNSQASVTGC